jgi:cell division protein FtsZ
MIGTGEGSGEYRALAAAEQAIANPVLDGVSMQGAKGVIISIIGGEDMKLLEVDEAANHIRELVDPNANIIWGSAFNPDLQGTIRVSVVATGIEQTAEQAEEAARPLNLGVARGPARPQRESQPVVALRPEPAAPAQPEPEPAAEAAPLDLAGSELAEEASEAPAIAAHAPEPEKAAGAQAEEPQLKPAYASLTGVKPARYEPLDLGAAQQAAGEPAESAPDELLLDASRLAEKDQQVTPIPGRRRQFARPEAEAGGAAQGTPGATLFERMANLSRGVKSEPQAQNEGDGDDDGASISIPRFLSRQNNQ